jgi:hypothetical protein
MKNNILTLFFSIFCLFSAQAQSYWEKSLGGSGYDIGKKIIYNNDGTFIIAGEVASADGLGAGKSLTIEGETETADIVVTKYSPQGMEYWRTVVGGDGKEELSDFLQTSDGGFALIGTTMSKKGQIRSSHGDRDIFVLRLTSAGQVKWVRDYGGIGNDRGFGITEIYDKGFIIAGETGSLDGTMQSKARGGLDGWMARIDFTGEVMWEKKYGGTDNEKIENIIEINDSSFVAVATSGSKDVDFQANNGQQDAWFFGFDWFGKMSWQKNYGGELNENVHGAKLDKDGNIVVAGTTFSKTGKFSTQHGMGDFWILKMDKEGNLLFSKNVGGAKPEGASDVICTSDGGYLMVGMTQSKDGDVKTNNGVFDGMLAKVDKNGELKWVTTAGYDKRDYLYSAVETAEGSYICVGMSQKGLKTPKEHHGAYDIWVANFSEPNNPNAKAAVSNPILSGKIVDKTTQKPVRASMRLFDSYTSDSLTSVATNPDNGEFMMMFPAIKEDVKRVNLSIIAAGYLIYEVDWRLDSLLQTSDWEKTFQMQAIADGAQIPLTLYFDSEQSEPSQAKNAELDRLVIFLRKNPNIQLLIEGHTDLNESNPIKLSEARAAYLRDYLLKRNVADNRLIVKGLAGAKPIEMDFSSEARKKNRRVNCFIVKK